MGGVEPPQGILRERKESVELPSAQPLYVRKGLFKFGSKNLSKEFERFINSVNKKE